MNWTAGKASIAVFGLCLGVVTVLAAAGYLGSLDFTSGVGWMLAVWLAGYSTIAVMLVGGTIQWAVKELTAKDFVPRAGHE